MAAMETEYDSLRENISSNFAHLSDAQLQALMARNGLDAEAMEGFFDSLKSFASAAGKAVLSAAPSILPVAGTVLGTAFGGPLGAQLGGTLGSLAGKAVGAATGQSAAAGGGGGGGIGGILSGVAGSLLGGGGGSAASQLLQTITKPETMQALGSMAMGAMGKPNVQVGGASVPVGAFGTLLKTLIGQAELEYSEALAAAEGDGTPSYMKDFSGQPVADPAVPLNRAIALYQLLQASTPPPSELEASEADAAEADAAELDMEAMQAEYDEMELAEIYESEEA
jgi:hypothetical protein